MFAYCMIYLISISVIMIHVAGNVINIMNLGISISNSDTFSFLIYPWWLFRLYLMGNVGVGSVKLSHRLLIGIIV